MINTRPVPIAQRAVIVLTGFVVGAILIVGLQWGRPVLLPIALAVLLTFLLNPIVTYLNRRGVNRIAAVGLAAIIAGSILAGLGWIVTTQVSGMLEELPRNTQRIKEKVRKLKEFGSSSTREHIAEMIEEISDEFQPKDSQGKPAKAEAQEGKEPIPEPIVVRPAAEKWENYTGYIGSAFETLATLAFALVLLMFFLIEREDLRDRIVLLAGRARLAVTSKAVEDITDRVSRYVGMVALVNGGFGILLSIGLVIMGVPYAVLWGFLAATMRFIPYIGPWIGALFPIAMSFAMAEGWSQPLAVLVYVAVLELVSNNVVEPLLFGHTIGVSATAMLISAAFWLYLWGPIGLILSAPFAVCLVVIGKNVPQLGFLYLLLGDKPALSVEKSLYQRLMLGDDHEASRIGLKHLRESKERTIEQVYDQLFIPTLIYTNRDVRSEFLNETDQELIVETMRRSLDRIRAANKDTSENVEAGGPEVVERQIPRVKVLICPAASVSDQIVVEMLAESLDADRWEIQTSPLEALTSELVAEITKNPPDLVYIASIPPGGMGHAKYLCKRLRAASKQIPIIVGRCGQTRNVRFVKEQLELAGATAVVTSLAESRRLLNTRRPLVGGRHQESDSINRSDNNPVTRSSVPVPC